MKQVWKLFGIFIARLIGFLIKRFYNVLSLHEAEYLPTKLKYSALLQSFDVCIHLNDKVQKRALCAQEAWLAPAQSTLGAGD